MMTIISFGGQMEILEEVFGVLADDKTSLFTVTIRWKVNTGHLMFLAQPISYYHHS
jgi:hypothetical protein